MATNSPVKDDPAGPSAAPPQPEPEPASTPPAPPVKSEPPSSAEPPKPPSTPTDAPPTAAATATPPPPEPPATDADVIHVPSYSRWFSWNDVHECELRLLPEFFGGRSPSKNPRVYMYYRNSIISLFRRNPSRKVTFTEARKILVGDVGSIRRVFDFLDTWGLINYSGPASGKPLKWDDKESSKSGGDSGTSGGGGNVGGSVGAKKEAAKRLCNSCKSVCTIACFACDKYELTLCARCYVRGNYRVGVSSSDFKRVEINEDMKADWTEKETLHLLEAIMHYRDDWKRVAHHVGGRSEKECVSKFIKLPFAGDLVSDSYSEDMDGKSNLAKDRNDAESGVEKSKTSPSSKRMRLTPLADASNPIMAQAAFLSALAGSEVAEAAAQAAVRTLTDVEHGASGGSSGSSAMDTKGKDSANGEITLSASEGALMDANAQLEKEELDLERAVSEIVELQMKEIHDKIVRFEELDILMEKETQQLEQMKHMLFADQLSLLPYKNAACKTEEGVRENVSTGRQ